MLDLNRSPLTKKIGTKFRGSTSPSRANPFDSSNKSERDQRVNPPRGSLSKNPFDDEREKHYKNGFRESGGLEGQTVQELENFALYKAEETTSTVNSCLKIAEGMREEATNTLVTLHQQGEQITHTHMVAVDIDRDLSRGEKLLGSLGGIFSKTWKPKKNNLIRGPDVDREDPAWKRGNRLERRENRGRGNTAREQGIVHGVYDEPSDVVQTVELERKKQDDTLSDISTVLGELKLMAVDMGSEIERQNRAIDNLYDDVDELNFRVKDANQRGRRLLGK